MKLHHLLLLTLSLFSTSSCYASSVSADGRPRGIKKVDIPLYTSSTFACRSDPSIVIPASHINDDYCDCTDGSDEPGTSACEHGSFWCRNVGWRGELLRSSRINDGICDCCDGSDEWDGRVSCPNTCIELGKAAGEDQLAKIQKMEAGASQRATLISEAQRILAERQAKLAKYETRIGEKAAILESVKTQKEAAEAVEAEEKRIADEAAAAKAAEEERLAQEKAAAEAEAAADAAAANPPVEGGEQIPPSQGEPTIETQPSQEYPVDIDIPAVPGMAGVGIAGVGMAGVGIPRAPIPPPAEPEPAVESFPYPAEYAYNPNADKKADAPVEDPVLKEAQQDDEDDDESERASPPPPVETDTRTEAQKGHDSSTASTEPESSSWLGNIWDWVWPSSSSAPIINDSVSRLSAAISAADALRAQYSEIEASHRKTQDKLEKVKKLLANDYGESGEFTTLEGQCYQIVIRQYTYEVCPYDESRQIENHSRTSLGRYSGWKQRVIDPLATPDKGYVYPRVMEFTGGQTCWNGPARSAQIEFECGETTAILTVDEPSRCVYAMRMSTPAVCQPEDIQAMRMKLETEMKVTAEMED